MGRNARLKKQRKMEWVAWHQDRDEYLAGQKVHRNREIARRKSFWTNLPDGWIRESECCDVFEDAIRCNFFLEKDGLIKRKEKKLNMDKFDLGRLELFEALDMMILLNAAPENHSADPLSVKSRARNAGQMIFDSWKEAPHLQNPMHDPLIWLFIPDGLHRLLDYWWDGIGEWKC